MHKAIAYINNNEVVILFENNSLSSGIDERIFSKKIVFYLLKKSFILFYNKDHKSLYNKKTSGTTHKLNLDINYNNLLFLLKEITEKEIKIVTL